MSAHPGGAVGGKGAPLLPVGQGAQDRFGHGLFVQGIYKKSVAAVPYDVDGAAVLRGHDGQPAGGGFDQGQAEGLGQGRVDENPARSGREPKEGGHVLRPVMLGIGDLAVEVVAVDGEQDLVQDASRPFVHVLDVVAVSGHDDQVGGVLEFLAFAVGVHEGDDVLLGVGPGEGEHHGFVASVQEALEFGGHGTVFLAFAGRVETVKVRARRNHAHAFGLIEIVKPVLLLDLLAGAGDDALGRSECGFLGFDAARHVVGVLDPVPRDAAGQQTQAFAAAQGVAGVHQGDAELVREPGSDIARVGIMAVQDVGHAILAFEKSEHVVGEIFQAVPEQFLAQVFFLAAFDAHDARLFRERFLLARIVGADRVVHDPARDQDGFLHIRVLAQGAGQLDHVFDLAAGVRIAAQFHVMAPHQAVNAQEHDEQRFFGFLFACLHRFHSLRKGW